MTVYLDACFSGESQKGMLVQATSGITVHAKVPSSSKAMVVVTAAQNDQFASWDEEAKHGLFTKHLLDALRGKPNQWVGQYPRTTMRWCDDFRKAEPGSQRLGGRWSYWNRPHLLTPQLPHYLP